MSRSIAHPFMPNSLPAIKAEMLEEIGVGSLEALFEQIPRDHRLKRPLQLPPAILSEVERRRHLDDILSRNLTCSTHLNFLGAGCWQHYVPAVCDEIVGRSEFFTPVMGTTASEHGRYQTYFEFSAQLGELLNMDFVGMPVYSWGCAAGHAIRMASRVTGRREVVVPKSLDPERAAVIRNYCEPPEMANHITIREVDFDPATGEIDLADLRAKATGATAGIYIEMPGYLGVIESRHREIAAIAKEIRAELIVGVDPISLGVITPPGDYGADLVVGTMQTLGVHMNCGGGMAGFIASRDQELFVREYPSMMVTIAETIGGERAFSPGLHDQSSYGARDKGKDWAGTSVNLWAVANAAYMALLGPEGFRELGSLILQRSHYAASCLSRIPAVQIRLKSPFFKEFVVDFSQTGRTVTEVNKDLLRHHGIFGGKDLSQNFPQFGQSALYCVTEVHSKHDIDRLASALQEILA